MSGCVGAARGRRPAHAEGGGGGIIPGGAYCPMSGGGGASCPGGAICGGGASCPGCWSCGGGCSWPGGAGGGASGWSWGIWLGLG